MRKCLIKRLCFVRSKYVEKKVIMKCPTKLDEFTLKALTFLIDFLFLPETYRTILKK